MEILSFKKVRVKMLLSSNSPSQPHTYFFKAQGRQYTKTGWGNHQNFSQYIKF
jgi:hypothetical protein